MRIDFFCKTTIFLAKQQFKNKHQVLQQFGFLVDGQDEQEQEKLQYLDDFE